MVRRLPIGWTTLAETRAVARAADLDWRGLDAEEREGMEMEYGESSRPKIGGGSKRRTFSPLRVFQWTRAGQQGSQPHHQHLGGQPGSTAQ
jgi:hypothetical protein